MKYRYRGALFALVQRIGRSLMLPIAALPAAAIMVRLGEGDMLGSSGLGYWMPYLVPIARLLNAAGDAVISNLPLLFAVGVAIGFARKSDGSTALASVIGFLTYSAVTRAMSPYIMGAGEKLTLAQVVCLQSLNVGTHVQWKAMDSGGLCNIGEPPMINFGIFGGIVIGITTALMWERFHRIRLPEYLAFFGGRRFVPIVTAVAAAAIGIAMSFIYPLFNYFIQDVVAPMMLNPGNNIIGGFVFGMVTRLLIPLGLHHLLNAVPWLTVGQCQSESGALLHGDIACFFNGVEGSFQPYGYIPGAYMTGMFPIMLGGLLGAALAMYRAVPAGSRRGVKALLASAALTSFLTGVTEPLEFSFSYVAAPLYLVHALLTGSAFALVNWLGIRDGFSFSAGIIDYALNFTRSAELSSQGTWGPVLLLGVSVVYFVIYYAIFRFAITWFNIPTPGRENIN